VYDLETGDHHFHVGPGTLVVHNTDSVMIRWGPGVSVPLAHARGEEAAAAITALLRAGAVPGLGGAAALASSERGQHVLRAVQAVELTNEKVYQPYLLLQKKAYCGLKHTPDGRGGFAVELDIKGLDPVRRDRAKILRDTCSAVLKALLYEASPAAALDAVRRTLGDVLADRLPLEAFVLSKSIKGSYASNNLPHVQAWRRMTERGDEGIPPVGGRMQYVLTAGAGDKLYDRAEHPAHVARARLAVDRTYYIGALIPPVTKLLAFTDIGPQLAALFSDATAAAKAKALRLSSLSGFLGGGEEEEEGPAAPRPVLLPRPATKRREAAQQPPPKRTKSMMELFL